jgi:hypothetical protein
MQTKNNVVNWRVIQLWLSFMCLRFNDIRMEIVELGVWRGEALELVARALNETKGKNMIIGLVLLKSIQFSTPLRSIFKEIIYKLF